MPLADTRIKQAKPLEKPYKLSDGGGLYLHIQTSGAKYWRLAYRFGGKQKTLALGVYPDVSLASARDERGKARELLVAGIDPSTVMSKRVKIRATFDQLENSFEAVAREWHEKQKGEWTEHHAERVLRGLKNEVFPDIGNIPIAEVTAPQILAMLKKIESRDALELASRTQQRCSAIFRYAVQTGRVQHNPAADLRGVLKTRKVKHRAALSRADLPEFLENLDTYKGNRVTQLALKLILLTFVRTRELRGAKWKEFDLERAEWRVPAERMKMGIEHFVPLSSQAVEILQKLKPITGKSELVFPSERSLRKPVSENTMLYAMYRMGYHKRATVHGMRATASTILNESGFNPDAIERQLAHIPKDEVRAAYHRAKYLEERRNMMQWWADFLDGVSGTENVVPIKAGKS